MLVKSRLVLDSSLDKLGTHSAELIKILQSNLLPINQFKSATVKTLRERSLPFVVKITVAVVLGIPVKQVERGFNLRCSIMLQGDDEEILDGPLSAVLTKQSRAIW